MADQTQYPDAVQLYPEQGLLSLPLSLSSLTVALCVFKPAGPARWILSEAASDSERLDFVPRRATSAIVWRIKTLQS